MATFLHSNFLLQDRIKVSLMLAFFESFISISNKALSYAYWIEPVQYTRILNKDQSKEKLNFQSN